MLKLAQIGMGHDHAEGKMACVRKYPEVFEVVGIAEETPALMQERGSWECYHGIPVMTVEELLDLLDLDAVLVETEELKLVEMAQKCIDRGLHVHVLAETEAPAIQPGHVLVETEYSAVSAGTERANLMRMPNTDAYRIPEGSPVWGGGYSTVGIVRQTDEGVTSVAAGDRVVVMWGSNQQLNLVLEFKLEKEANHGTIIFSVAAPAHRWFGTAKDGRCRNCRNTGRGGCRRTGIYPAYPDDGRAIPYVRRFSKNCGVHKMPHYGHQLPYRGRAGRCAPAGSAA